MRIAGLYASDGSCKFLPYQLRMVGYWPTMALTGGGSTADENKRTKQNLLRKEKNHLYNMSMLIQKLHQTKKKSRTNQVDLQDRE